MKISLYIIIACVLFCSCAAQKNGTKIHAYSQPMLRGSNPVAIADEVSKEPRKEQVVRLSNNYMIYVESAAADMQVKNVWINKEGFAASAEVVQTTPVVMKSSMTIEKGVDTLVKQTNAKVLLVKLIAGSQVPRPSDAVQKKIDGNELVVHCVVNGKDKYYTVPAIKKLPPVALQ